MTEKEIALFSKALCYLYSTLLRREGVIAEGLQAVYMGEENQEKEEGKAV